MRLVGQILPWEHRARDRALTFSGIDGAIDKQVFVCKSFMNHCVGSNLLLYSQGEADAARARALARKAAAVEKRQRAETRLARREQR
eukprot:SAG31_NODE_26125_length_448_cov_0.581662_1_plen_86_part_01